MTCHVALVGANAAVTLCDSQGSTDISESHGLQKIVAGRDFLVGGTGSVDIINAVFARVTAESLSAADAPARIVELVNEIVAPPAQHLAEFLVTTAQGIWHVKPGMFRQARDRGRFFSVGSGAEFVFRAFDRDTRLGILLPIGTLADLVATAESFLDAANESLTVDDQFMFGMIVNGRTYLAGHAEVSLGFASQTLQTEWPQASARFLSILGLAESIRGELRTSQGMLSPIRIGQLGAQELQAMTASNASIQNMRTQLEQQLADFITWFDATITP